MGNHAVRHSKAPLPTFLCNISGSLLCPPPAWLNMGGQNLPDDGVHGCNAFCHNEGLTVGDIVQGRA